MVYLNVFIFIMIGFLKVLDTERVFCGVIFLYELKQIST